ncbi:UBA/TS-N domain containing protein [Trichomonas vaginalis G3]|uniref:UBA/TS-N domain containing protein n=1 Tax=Trichomonas vaginalis (strain ATCC PRA-98 / G3) TaxID=412133 RepID=A2ELL4_TRIV3|nr:UV excision repair protein RAD23 family [Trichomonas vaginalis G3]EAY06461.1 UBA/TS-N domain containing protein [Trichomonas vaginalis G3]KAI5548011.1 UV excision repair protein RAD23 family [Trichomonas vaginalis G3]|eukprot:XP_001318684.1 UBA/TS-N domain containing protein [Trichomonas vaginalis G3]
MSGRAITLPANKFKALGDVKEVLQSKYFIPKDDIKFLFGVEVLPDKKLVSEIELSRSDFIMIHQSNSYSKSLNSESKLKSYPRQTVGNPERFADHYSIVKEHAETIEDIQSSRKGIDIQPEDPSNFRLYVQQLVEMGFEQDKVVELLRKHNYNVPKCLDILIKGVEPEEKPPEKEYDVSDLAKYNFQEFSELLDDLTNLEKHNLLILLRTHFSVPPIEIIQLFISCDKNMEAVDHNLLDN